MTIQSIHLHTIGALMSLKGFVNNEIAKHESLGDTFSANHWKNYLDKIDDLEEQHYTLYHQSKNQ